MNMEVPWEDVSEILLGDGWHQPVPGSLYEVEPNVGGIVILSDMSQNYVNVGLGLGPDGCVTWSETDKSSSTTVVVKKNAINGIRIRNRAIDKARIAELRLGLQHPISAYQKGSREDYILRQIANRQRVLAFLRERNPEIQADPLNDWPPPPF
jgi:hypothetical protein